MRRFSIGLSCAAIALCAQPARAQFAPYQPAPSLFTAGGHAEFADCVAPAAGLDDELWLASRNGMTGYGILSAAPSGAGLPATNLPPEPLYSEPVNFGTPCPGECHHDLTAFLGYDTWRAIPDGSWQNNGLHTGVNFGTRLGEFSEWTGIGFQIGGIVGVYDWNGAEYRLRHSDQGEVQGFITYGFFRHATADSRWSAALVQDWMINDNFGVFAETPTLSQLRGQVGYAPSDWNEYGFWFSQRVKDDTRDVPYFGSTTWRAVNQYCFYWRHKWMYGADSSIFFGVPEHDRLVGGGSLGDYVVGAAANVPLNDYIALYTLVSYMHPSASQGSPGADEEAWSFVIGLSYSFGGRARTETVTGHRWAPLAPLATNGLFLVDTNQYY